MKPPHALYDCDSTIKIKYSEFYAISILYLNAVLRKTDGISHRVGPAKEHFSHGRSAGVLCCGTLKGTVLYLAYRMTPFFRFKRRLIHQNVQYSFSPGVVGILHTASVLESFIPKSF